MGKKIIADFETRSPVDIKVCGAYKYAQHPDTDVTMLAILDCDSPSDIRMWIGPNFRHLYETEISDEELDSIVSECDSFIAHNCPFERTIWHYVMCKRYGFKALDIHKTVDTAVMCSMVGLPRNLEKASEYFNPSGFEKDMEGSKVMKRFIAPKLPVAAKRRVLCPENPDSIKEGYERAMAVLKTGGVPEFEYSQYLDWHEDKNDFIRMVEYCRRDVISEHYLYDNLPKIHPSEHAIWVLDQEINDRGICLDIKAAHGIACTVSKYGENLMNEVLELTDGKVTSMKSPAQVKSWLSSEGIEVTSVDKASVEYLLTLNLKPKVRRFLEIRTTLGKSSIAKYNAMFACASNEDNRVRGIHAFAGAQTGRWCLAEGTPVYIKDSFGEESFKPIEEVTTEDLVFDGKEWVSHDGVVYQGIKEVVEYGGLKATLDHKVYISDTECLPFEKVIEKGLCIWKGEKA